MIGDIVAGLFIYNFVLPLCIALAVVVVAAIVVGVCSAAHWFEKAWKKVKGE